MKLPALAAAGLLAAATAACASVNTEPDETAIVYTGALGSATTFSKCVTPSSRQGVAHSDNSWTYPAGQRTFDFTGSGDAETKPLTVVSKDNVELTVPGSATFALNTTCTVLRDFHERIGLKYRAFVYGTDFGYDESGWKRMLNFYLKQPLDRALDAASQEFEWRKLYNDPATKQQWEARVGQLARQFIKETAGGDYFCQPTFKVGQDCTDLVLTIQKPQPPKNLVESLAAVEAAKAQNQAQQQINAKVDTELESMKKLVGLLGPDAYIKYRAVLEGKTQVIIADGGGNITVAPKQSK